VKYPNSPQLNTGRRPGPLRVLIAAETYPPDVNGAARFAHRLAHGLSGRGHEVHVVAPSPVGRPVVETSDGVTVHGLRSVRYPAHESARVVAPWHAAAAAGRLLDRIQPDVVHTQGHFLVGRGVVAATARRGYPLVATNHLMPENVVSYLPIPEPLTEAFAAWAGRDISRVYGRAQIVTAPTPRAVDLLVARAGLTDAIAVSNGIDSAHFAAPPRAATTEPTILFVGRLDVEKRVDELIRAVAMLPESRPGRVEIVGKGGQAAALAALANDLGVSHRVTFRGFVPDDELVAAYAGADVFCMPSVAELQSLVTLEAMSSGLPVVAADAMALPHLVRPGVNGWLYTPGDVRELANRLGDLLADADLRHRMGAASRELVVAHAEDGTLDAFEMIYEKVRSMREPAAA
jgi:phosphatidylinositol alpha 1,6-mannosyltransferase